jgi:hypothetical protein
MSDPTGTPPNTTTLQRIVNLDRVPPQKWQTIVLRTIIGTLLTAAGLGLLYAMVRVYIASQALSGWLLASGLALVVAGTTTWSTQLLTGTAMALLGPFKAWRRAVRDGNGGDAK